MSRQDTVLKRLRKQRGLVKEAAKKVGVSRATICYWDNMRSEPATAEHRLRYAEFLGVSVGQLGAMVYEESIKQPERRRRDRGRA